MSTGLQRAEALLMGRAGKFITRSDLADAICVQLDGVNAVINKLRAKYGDLFIVRGAARGGRGREHSYALSKKAVVRTVTVRVPDDLFRGWVNPATGVIPPKLGL